MRDEWQNLHTQTKPRGRLACGIRRVIVALASCVGLSLLAVGCYSTTVDTTIWERRPAGFPLPIPEAWLWFSGPTIAVMWIDLHPTTQVTRNVEAVGLGWKSGIYTTQGGVKFRQTYVYIRVELVWMCGMAILLYPALVLRRYFRRSASTRKLPT